MISHRAHLTFLLGALLGVPAFQTPGHRVQILFASDYFPNQIDAASGESWYGLFPAGNQWRLATTKIRVEPVSSGCIENGSRVTVDRSEHPLLLLRGLPRLRSGVIETASVARVRLKPGERRDFQVGKRRFRLVAAGGGPGQEVRDYQLRLIGVTSGASQVIVTEHRLDGMPS